MSPRSRRPKSLVVLSVEHEASKRPSSEKITRQALSEWPVSVCSNAPVAVIHSLTVLSIEADATR